DAHRGQPGKVDAHTRAGHEGRSTGERDRRRARLRRRRPFELGVPVEVGVLDVLGTALSALVVPVVLVFALPPPGRLRFGLLPVLLASLLPRLGAVLGLAV